MPTENGLPVVSYSATLSGSVARWGRASCVRAGLSFAICFHVLNTVEMNLPRDNLKATLWWPLALMFCTIGVVYGVMGLRRDQRRRAAVCGLVLNSILSIPAIPKTWEAVRDVLDAYKYSKGVIVSADR